MGLPLDSRMQYDYPGVGFTPFVGCKVYNPQGHTIDTYVGQLGDSWEISSRQVSTNDLYLNLRTGRAYTWNGTEMVNAHLSPDVTTGSIPACDHDFSQSNTTYCVSEPITQPATQPITIGSGSTIEFYGNGCFNGCKLIGSNVKIVPHGTQQIFKGCSFELNIQDPDAEYFFVDSQLYATNFGAISDMHTVECGSWDYRGLHVENLKVHRGYSATETGLSDFSGTINDNAWTQMVGFLKNSNGISIEFNGKFMGYTVNDLSIRGCRNLELSGGTMLRGFAIIDSQYVDIHDMNFVGVHEVHDFPTILNDKTAYIQELQQRIVLESDWSVILELSALLNNELNQTYNCTFSGDNLQYDLEGVYHNVEEGDDPVGLGALISCGLSGNGVVARRENADFADCHVSVHDCHFEMRQGGVAFNSLFKDRPLEDVKILSHGEVRDCTFSHIYFQPVGSHAEHVTIENIQSEYCLQGLDISTCASNTVVRNCVFRKCSFGPKQETYDPYTPLTHDNVVENCLFEMTDDYLIKNTGRYVLCVNKGLANDTFVMRNCQFTVNSAYRFGGMVFRSWRTVLDNVKVRVDIDRGEETGYDILYMIGVGGATPHSPIVEMSHVDIECNARIESLAFRGVSLSDAGPLQLHMSHVHVHGTGRANILFEKMDKIEFNKSVFDLASTSFVRYSHDVAIRGCRVRQIAATGILAYTITDTDCLIEDSDIEVGSRLLWLQQTGGSIIVRRNRIRCAPLISCKWDGSAHIEITGNDITDTSGSGTQLVHPVDQSGYDFWTDGGQNELIVNNNMVRYPSSGTKNVVYPARYADYAHLFYSNFLDHGVKPFNTGTAGERPTSPWQGMLHLEGSSYFAYRLTQWLELMTAVPNL